MKSAIIFSVITVVLVLLQSCAHLINCPEPTAIKMSSETSAKIDAQLIKAATMNVSYEKKAEQLRQELPPELQSFEVIDYRACKAYQNGLIDKERYNELINMVLPLIIKPAQAGKIMTASAAPAGDGDLIIVKNNDVLIHDRVIQSIRGYTPGEPVYIAYGEPFGCGPKGNDWLTSENINVKQYEIHKENNYWRAKNMAGIQFQVVQLVNGQPGRDTVKWATLEDFSGNKNLFLGRTYKEGTRCEAKGRYAIFVEK